MATEEAPMDHQHAAAAADKYRYYLVGESEKYTQWRHGAPPQYDHINKLFEEGRTQEWPKGSLEETVQNAIKTWEMELSHKIRPQDIKTINPEKFRLIINGRKGFSLEAALEIGGYNVFLQSSLPEDLQGYKADNETPESSQEVFRTVFPRGFALEVLKVYSGPPVIAFKYRHWGYMEGPYKGHAPTGEIVEFTGVAVLKVDDGLKIGDMEIFYDPGELLGGFLKGPLVDASHGNEAAAEITSSLGSCPFFKEK